VHDFPPFASEAEHRFRIAEYEWWGAWLPAARKYMFTKRGSVNDLARRLKITRQLAVVDKRPSAKLSPAEELIRSEHVKLRKELEEMIVEAIDTKGEQDFFHRLWQASKIADGKIFVPMDVKGAVVLAADKLWHQLRRKATRKEIESLVKRWMREGKAGARTQKRWKQIFSDPLIAALIQND
jgi:hypothetical protein